MPPRAATGGTFRLLYPVMSSHRMGVRESLVRMSVGIEAVEDIIADLEQALGPERRGHERPGGWLRNRRRR